MKDIEQIKLELIFSGLSLSDIIHMLRVRDHRIYGITGWMTKEWMIKENLSNQDLIYIHKEYKDYIHNWENPDHV